MILIILFWLATLFILYTYGGYPIAIYWLSKKKNRPKPYHQRIPPEQWPSVAVLIPVHNEAQHIDKKIASLHAIDYPADRISFTFISDGSEDETNQRIINHPKECNLIQYQPRAGKPTALNKGAAAQSADILVFTDARQEIEASAIKRLVTRLQDPTIGAVSGELVFRDSTSKTAAPIGLYWQYEKWIREAESRYASTAGVTGALYAIRRLDYAPLYEDAILDDFEIPAPILRSGQRVVFETDAHVYDQPQTDTTQEKIRKIRTLTGNFQSFTRNAWLFSPNTNPIFWQFLSHKVFRLMVPYMLFLIAFTSLMIPGPMYKVLFLVQVVFYAIGFSRYYLPPDVVDHIQKNKLGNFVRVFTELNWAAVVAGKNFIFKNIDIKWKKT